MRLFWIVHPLHADAEVSFSAVLYTKYIFEFLKKTVDNYGVNV